MANFFTDNEDLQYYFAKGIDWASLVAVTERGFADPDGPKSVEEAVDTYRATADLVGRFAADEVAPKSKEMDDVGAQLVDGEVVLPTSMNKLFDRIRELDLHWLPIPRELGGMNCPMLLYFINTELLGRADVAVMAHHGFHGGIAMALLLSSIREGSTVFEGTQIASTRFGDAIRECGEGKAWGCMDITEPDAGSDMAALRSVGEQDAEGNWTVSGQKIFITSGHGKYHFVIARTEKPDASGDLKAGLAGLSFFLVPTYHDGPDGKRQRVVTIDRLEDKLGQHASSTATLTFDRAPAQLVGQRGEGFKYMLTLMNNARVTVGFECLGTCEAAYRLARAYAEQRPSMGKTIDRHELIADVLDEMNTWILALRAMAMDAAVHEEIAQKLQLLRDHIDTEVMPREELEEKLRFHQAASRRATPLLKYLSAEKAVWVARMCMQIHGGNGYMREYGAERLMRDSLVMPIYEGTSQIQALMAMKDTLGGIIKAPQEFVRKQAQTRWRALSARDALERRVAKLQVLSLDAQQHLLRKTAADKLRKQPDVAWAQWAKSIPKTLTENWDPKRDFAFAMLHAERLCELLGLELIAENLLSQARKHPERAEVLRRFLERAEPRARHLLDLISNTGLELLERLAQRDGAEAQAAE